MKSELDATFSHLQTRSQLHPHQNIYIYFLRHLTTFSLMSKDCTQMFVQVLFKYPQVSFQIDLKQLSSGGWINKLWCHYSAITYILKNHCNMRNCAMKTIGLQGNRVGTQHSSTSSMTPWKNQESNKIVAQLYICEIININTTVKMTL